MTSGQFSLHSYTSWRFAFQVLLFSKMTAILYTVPPPPKKTPKQNEKPTKHCPPPPSQLLSCSWAGSTVQLLHFLKHFIQVSRPPSVGSDIIRSRNQIFCRKVSNTFIICIGCRRWCTPHISKQGNASSFIRKDPSEHNSVSLSQNTDAIGIGENG